MRTIISSFLVLFPFLAVMLPAFSQAQDHVTVTVVGPATVEKGKEFQVIARLVMKEGIHIYARHKQEGGTPTEVAAVPVQGLRFGEPEFPKPLRKNYPSIGGEFDLYEGTLEVPVKITIEKNGPTGEIDVSFKVTYGACTDEVCYAPQKNKVYSTRIKIVDPPGAEVKPQPPVVPPVPGDPKKEDKKPEVPEDESGLLEYLNKGTLAALAFVFVGGIGTSFTPCVFPMIPITVSFFQLQAGGSRSKRFMLALIYVLGIALTFSILGLAFAMAGKSTARIQGNIFVMMPIVLCFAAMGLSMFGLFEIRLPHQLMSKIGGGKSGAIGALVMGLVLGLIAAPCVGPVILGILLFITRTQDPVLGFSLLFTYALGIGVLFIVLALFSVSLPKSGRWMILVKEIFGAMLFLGALYFLQAFVSLELLAVLIGILLIAWGLLVWMRWKVLGGLKYPVRLIPILFFLLCAVVGSAFVVSPLVPIHEKQEKQTLSRKLIEAIRGKSLVKWVKWNDRVLVQAREEGRPVLMDFWATWCAYCLQMDSSTFSDPDVFRNLQRFVTVKVDVSETSGPEYFLMEKTHKISQPPALVVYDSRGNHVKTINRYVSAAELLEILKKVP